jgi:chromosome partitioning protein
MMELIRVVRTVGNPDLLYRIVITLFEKRNRVHRNMRMQFEYTFETGVLKTIIEFDKTLKRVPVLSFHTLSGRGVRQYRKLVDELLECIQIA